MKGLKLFISDLKACRGKEEEIRRVNEELAKIRNKFNGAKILDGYQKRKYICKLVFIFLMGHECSFGMMEAINLLSSNAYKDKKTGYLFLSLKMGEDHNLMPLVINSLKNDLSSSNNVFQNQALQFIANSTFKTLADSLADSVINILLSYNSVDFVRQSAALALLQILRIKSDLALDQNKLNRIVSLISHHNLGVVTAAISLIEFLVKNVSFKYESCMTQCIVRLNRTVQCACIDFRDYNYYSVAAPWISVKLLRILQNFPEPNDKALKARLVDSFMIILRPTNEQPKVNKFEHTNAKYAVIFEAIALAIQMELYGYIRNRSFNILEEILKRKEVNLRLMSIEMMSRLTSYAIYREHIKSRWNIFLDILKSEYDVNIKKCAIDLLYTICNENNVKPIVGEMLYLLECKYDYTEDVALMTAALAEQFGVDREWYVQTIFNLFKICGDEISDSIWHALVKQVIINDNIQAYAANMSYAVLCEKNCNDTVIKMASYILGEFGYLIAKNPKSSPVMQFNVVREKYNFCRVSTKALLLTTFMKFLNIYSELKNEIQIVFQSDLQNVNEEIQQRAVEYLKLSKIASRNLLAAVLEEMPSDSLQQSATKKAIEVQKFRKYIDRIHNTPSKKTLTMFRSHYDLGTAFKNSDVKTPRMTRSASHFNLQSQSNNLTLLMDIFKDTPVFGMNILPEAPLSRIRNSDIPNNQPFLYNMLFNEEAKLFENDVIAIIIEGKFRRDCGVFRLKFFNKTISNLFITVKGDFTNLENKCSIHFSPSITRIPPNGEIQEDMQIECLREFSEKPCLNLELNSGSQQHGLKLILPLTLNKFVEPAYMIFEEFNQKWHIFEGRDLEIKKEFPAKYPMLDGVIRTKLKGFRLAVIDNVDGTYSGNFHCAGMFYTNKNKTGFLIRLEKNALTGKYCSRVRSYKLGLSRIVSDLLYEML